MGYGGRILDIADLIAGARRAPEPLPRPMNWTLPTAKDCAADCRRLLAHGESAYECWRFGILQTLDHYEATRRHNGTSAAAALFEDEPEPTGSLDVDAAFAALADFLAERDHWPAPSWTHTPGRYTFRWYVAGLESFREQADLDTPQAFRRHGVMITEWGLSRA